MHAYIKTCILDINGKSRVCPRVGSFHNFTPQLVFIIEAGIYAPLVFVHYEAFAFMKPWSVPGETNNISRKNSELQISRRVVDKSKQNEVLAATLHRLAKRQTAI